MPRSSPWSKTPGNQFSAQSEQFSFLGFWREFEFEKSNNHDIQILTLPRSSPWSDTPRNQFQLILSTFHYVGFWREFEIWNLIFLAGKCFYALFLVLHTRFSHPTHFQLHISPGALFVRMAQNTCISICPPPLPPTTFLAEPISKNFVPKYSYTDAILPRGRPALPDNPSMDF